MAVNNNLTKNTPDAEPLAQIVYTCLTNIFNNEEAKIALESWAYHTSQGNSAFNGVNSFAREVCNNLNRPEKHRELVKELNRALIIQLSPSPIIKSNLPDSSEVSSENLESAKSTESFSGNKSFLTFQFIILEIMSLLASHGETVKSEAVAFLNEITETMPWSEIQQQQILDLINNGELQPLRTYKLDQLKNFIKYFKSWISDELGPDTTSQIVSQVIEHVATLEETKNSNPKNFFTA